MSKAARSTRVRVEPEHFIPVSKRRLVQSLLKEIDDPGRKGQFEEFCRLIEATYHFHYHQISQELKQDFQRFDSVDGQVEIAGLTDREVEQIEDRFLTNFARLMEKANFRLLSQADIEVAQAEEYLFSLPVEVDWDKLDREMLGRFLRSRPEALGGAISPQFADRILIFHRGVGVDRTRGYLILQKVDFLVTRLLEWITKPFVRGTRCERGDGIEPSPQADNRPETAEEHGPGDSGSGANCVFADRSVERINLRSTGVGFRSLFQRTLMQEPTFKELVILFRFATPGAADAGELPPKRDRRILVKAFRDIPMADLEVVYPAKRISMNLIDRIKLAVIGCMGVVAVFFKLAFTAAFNPFLLLAALASMGGYAGKIFAGFKAAKDRYQHLVTQSLYHKNLDNDLGVIFYVVDALEEQEFNEAVLAYFILSRDGEMTEGELDASCEQHLKRHFNVEVDFEVRDALAKLVRKKIVIQTGARYRAAPLSESLRQLDCNWDDFFSFNRVESAAANEPDAD